MTVHQLEEGRHVFDLGASGSFNQLIDDLFFLAVVLNTVPFKFSDELSIINIT